jgi:hypothetical protein
VDTKEDDLGEMRIHTSFCGKRKGKKPLGRSRHRRIIFRRAFNIMGEFLGWTLIILG